MTKTVVNIRYPNNECTTHGNWIKAFIYLQDEMDSVPIDFDKVTQGATSEGSVKIEYEEYELWEATIR